MPSLGASFGRGAATLAQWDVANSDCVLVMGSNMAENHPVAFRFVMEAKKRGAAVMHVDPRFTRTSAMADLYAPIRAGTDIAFLGGIIHHILEHDLWFREYALAYTNLSTIISAEFVSAEESEDGHFSGWHEDTQSYEGTDSWQYLDMLMPSALAEHYLDTAEQFNERTKELHERPPERDDTLQHPNCVYQIMRRHYARYTPAMVEEVTGCPRDTFVDIANTLARNSGRGRTGVICYAVGWTHHSVGVQIIRAASIIQSLLGNIGRPGGGILALRGHASIQGSTDIPTLYNMLPGYMPQPHALRPQTSLRDYLDLEQVPTGWWHNFPKYFISLLKAWYGDAAKRENDFGYSWTPKIVGDHSQLPMTLAVKDGLIRGLFLMGQNPVIGTSNSTVVEEGLAKLDWLVVRDTTEIESANFWRKGNLVRDGKTRPEEIGVEIFLMPAALSGEKDGTFTNTHRLVQWHDRVVAPPGDSRSDLWFMVHLGHRLKRLYAGSKAAKDQPLLNLTLDYPLLGEDEEPSTEAVLKEINGYTVRDRKQVESFKDLKDDGSTACGCWLYCGVFPSDSLNKARERKPDVNGESGVHLGWAFAWPANRRTLYNRASADPSGRPWSERKKLVWWDADANSWKGDDAIDFEEDKAPDYEPDWKSKPEGMAAISGSDPFIMIPDGRAALFVTSGLKEGPLPTHFEPIETPVKDREGRQPANPAAKLWVRADNPLHHAGDADWPHVLTTYRLTEHHSGGAPTRAVPTTAELQPEAFVEISPELAEELNIANTEWVTVSTKRGAVEARALVTARIRPFEIDGRRVHQIGMPWHFGWEGYATGDIANVLTALVGDPNTSMHENKALTCALRKGRLRRESAR